MYEAFRLECLAYLAVVKQLEDATDAALAKEPKRPREPHALGCGPDDEVSDHGVAV